MKAVVTAFNQEKALVGAFSVITNLRMELFQALVCRARPQCSDVVFVHSEDQKCGLSDCPDFQGGCGNGQFLIFEHLHSQLSGPKTKTCLLTHPSIEGFASVNPDEGLSNFTGHIRFEWNILHCKLHVARRSLVLILLHPGNKKQVNLRTGDDVRGTIET